MRREIGRVMGLWRYPVKSMAAERLDEAAVSWHGLAGDRRWAFVQDGKARSGFPWLTIRQRNDLCRYRPFVADPGRPDASAVLVRTPAGEVHDVTDPVLAAELGHGRRSVRVQKQDRGIFDSMPLSLITTRSVHSAAGDADGNVLRFRPNLLVEADSAEESWIGHVLRVGELGMRIDRRDRRCVVVNVDPATARRDPSLLRVIAREHDMCLGVYGSTVEPGHVSVGDPVVIETA